MTSPTFTALRRHNERVAGMLADPDLLGDLLLVGLVFARSYDLGDPPLERVVREAATMLYGNRRHAPQLHSQTSGPETHPRVTDHGVGRVRDILASDIRRYRPDFTKAYRCQRPTARRGEHLERSGELCGKNGWPSRTLLVDPVDGTRHAIGVCQRPRCTAWWDALLAANRAELAANPAPEPVANCGGVLERHLDEIDWPALYAHLDPEWKPPHEAPGWRPPTLRLIVAVDDLEPVAADRPALSVVKGGWR